MNTVPLSSLCCYTYASVPILLPVDYYFGNQKDLRFQEYVEQVTRELTNCFKDDIHPVSYDIYCIYFDLLIALPDQNIEISSQEEIEHLRKEVYQKLKLIINFESEEQQNGS